MQVILLLAAFLFSFEKLSSPKRQKWRIEMKNLNEAKAGVIALNVVSDDKFLEINGVKIERKEYKGQNVVSVYDISSIHQKEVRAVNQQFKRNKGKFMAGKDYFELKRTEINQSQIVIGSSKHSSNEFENLFTERGYLKLTKTFNDDFSWKVQDILVDEYFNMKKLRTAIENGEVSIIPKISREDELVLNIAKARNDAEIAVEFAKYRNEIVEPLRKDAQRYRKFLDKNGTIRATDIAGLLGVAPAFVNAVMNYAGIIVRDGKGWKPQKSWGGKGVMKLIETSYFVKRPAQDSQAGNSENELKLLSLETSKSVGDLLPAVSETGKKEVDKIEFRYTIEGAELIEKIFLESGLVVKDENGNYSENKELVKKMRAEYNNFKETGKRNFKIDNNIIIFPEN